MYYEKPGDISYKSFFYALRILSLVGFVLLVGGLTAQHYRIEPLLQLADMTIAMTLIFGSMAIVAISILLVVDYRTGLRRWKQRQADLRLLASREGFTAVPYAPKADHHHKGTPFTIQQDYQLTEIAQFTDTRASFEIGTLVYATRRSVGQSDRLGYIAIALEREVPQILLDAKHNNTFGSNLLQSARKQQTISLEGDFHKHFTVYGPKDLNTDIRAILTPDAMALLIDEAANYDIEFVDKTIYIYKSGGFDLLDTAEYDRCLQLVERIGGKAKARTKHYKLEGNDPSKLQKYLDHEQNAVLFSVLLYAPLPFAAAFITYLILDSVK